MFPPNECYLPFCQFYYCTLQFTTQSFSDVLYATLLSYLIAVALLYFVIIESFSQYNTKPKYIIVYILAITQNASPQPRHKCNSGDL